MYGCSKPTNPRPSCAPTKKNDPLARPGALGSRFVAFNSKGILTKGWNSHLRNQVTSPPCTNNRAGQAPRNQEISFPSAPLAV